MPATANPYIAGSPVTGEEMFFGREDVFASVKQALTGQHRDHVLVLYGQRRTGKTSVLYQMHRHLGSRYLCIFIDLHGLALSNLDGFIWELASHISRSLRRDYQIQVPRPERAEFMEDPRGNFEANFLESVLSAIGDRHVLLMLDEAIRLEEQVRAGRLEPEIFEYLRHLMQHYPRLNFLFSLGSGLEEMEKEYAFLFNVALYKKISFLDRRSAVELITRPVEGLYELEPDAVERIIHITSAHPYFIQLICHSLFNYRQNHSLSTVRVQDVQAVLDETVERGLAVLKYVWEESTPAEKAVLAAMAAASDSQGTSVSTGQLRKRWEEQGVAIPPGEIAQAIRSLISRDVITGEERYHFTVDLQRLWVQKYRRLEWVREEIEPAARRWTQEEAAPKPLLERSWLRRRRLVLPLLGLLIALCACSTLLFYRLFGLPRIFPPDDLVWESSSRCCIRAVAVSPDGDFLTVGGGFDDVLEVWSLQDFSQVEELQGHNSDVNDLAYSPEGTLLASAGDDRAVIIWDTNSGEQLKLISDADLGRVMEVAWSPDGSVLATVSDDNRIRLWDTGDWSRIIEFDGGPVDRFPGPDIAFNANGRALIAGSERRERVWSVPEAHEILDFPSSPFMGDTVSASPVDPALFASAFGRDIRIWRLGQEGQQAPLATFSAGDSVQALSFTPHGALLVAMLDDSIEIWRTSDWEPAHHIRAGGGGINSLEDIAFSPDSTMLATVFGNKIQVWRLPQALAGLAAPTPGPAVAAVQPREQTPASVTTTRPAATAPPAATAEPAAGIVPGGDAALVNELEALGDYVWAATDGGLVRWRLSAWNQPGGSLLVPGGQLGFPDDCANTVTADAQGDLWLGCGGVARVRPEGDRILTLDYYNRDDGLDMGAARALTVDGQGRVWVGGNSGASGDPPLNYFDGQSHPDGLAWQSDETLNQAMAELDVAPSVSSLLADQDGTLWIGLEDGEVLRWDGSGLDRFSLQAPETAAEPIRDRRVRDLLQDQEGQLWAAASEQGLFRFDEEQGGWLPMDVAGIGGAVNSVAKLSDDTLWVGGEQAVAMSRDGGGTWTLVGQDLGDDIGGLVEDALGQVWAGSYGQGVSVYKDQTWLSLQR